MESWTKTKTDWKVTDKLPTVDDFDRIEKNTLHLKQKPNDDFDLMGRTGQGWFTSAATQTMFYVAKRIPPRTSVYLREVSKCFPMPDGDERYCLLRMTSIVSYPKDSNLNWYTQPDINPLVRWISSKTSYKYIEHYYYGDLGLKLLTNPLYVNAYVSFVGQMLSPRAGRHSPEDTLYMRFHIGYDDI